MRLPNGYGSVYKLSGNRRKPWAARKTTGWSFDGGKSFPIYHFIGYYTTRKEALLALAEYNKAPYDLTGGAATLGSLFERWKEVKREAVTPGRFNSLLSCATVIEPLFDTQVDRLETRAIQAVVDASGRTKSVVSVALSILGQVADYGIKQGAAPASLRDVIRNVDNSGKEGKKTPRAIFSSADLAALWGDASIEADIILALYYTGLRSGEYYALKPEDVDLKKRAIYVRKGKTAAAVREVPICDKLLPRFRLPPDWGKKGAYSHRLSRYMVKKCSGRLLHDTRHSFITALTSAGIDDRVIKQIVGHKGDDVTMNVYTHLSLDVKLEAVNRAFPV